MIQHYNGAWHTKLGCLSTVQVCTSLISRSDIVNIHLVLLSFVEECCRLYGCNLQLQVNEVVKSSLIFVYLL